MTPENCMDCAFHQVLPDHNPSDWFCDDDVKVMCHKNRQLVTVACRPHHLRDECTPPGWCPLHEQPTSPAKGSARKESL